MIGTSDKNSTLIAATLTKKMQSFVFTNCLTTKYLLIVNKYVYQFLKRCKKIGQKRGLDVTVFVAKCNEKIILIII